MVDDTTQTPQQNWLQRTLDRVKSAIGIETQQQPAWKATSLSHALPGRGAHLSTVGSIADGYARPSQATERYEQSHTRVHPEHHSAISHTGAVREATTGNTYHRVDSEERMAKGYEAEREAREHRPHQLTGRELSL